MIYYKFSHGADSYTLNGKSVNVMLELFEALFYKFTLLTLDNICLPLDKDQALLTSEIHFQN